MKKTTLTRVRMLAAWLLLCLALTACSGGGTEERVAAYGEYGAELARVIARHFPFRSPGSEQEKQTADYLVKVLASIGYEATVQTFSYQDAGGATRTSQNVIAELPGLGFKLADEQEDKSGRIVIGAQYDVPVDSPNYVFPNLPEGVLLSKSYAQYNGIHDNASGVASVVSAALQMKRDLPGYHVTFVFFGAGNASYAGAEAYLQAMPAEQKAATACVYNVGPVYAGEKVYAHAGQNSIQDGTHKSYALRRKLYEATDIFFNYRLNTLNGYSLFTNQCTFLVDRPDGAGQAVFREWTTHTGSHTPFDKAGLPIVFFESGEYNVKTIDELGPENHNPEFRETGGRIAGSPFDDDQFLFNIFRRLDQAKQTEVFVLSPTPGAPAVGPTVPDEQAEETAPAEIDHLTRRINNTAFILVKAAQRGPEYSDILKP